MLQLKGEIMHVRGDSKNSDQIRFRKDNKMVKEAIFSGPVEVNKIRTLLEM